MTRHPEEEDLSFRPMTVEDLALLQAWMAEPHVARWWDDASETIEAVSARYEERVATDSGVAPWIFELDGRPVGFIQWYRPEHDPEWYPGLTIPPGTVAMDVAVGDPAAIDRGVGRRVVLEFVHHVLRPAAPDALEVWIDPDPANVRAVRAYRAAGFVDTGIELPYPDRPGKRRHMKLTFPGPAFR